MTFLFKHIVYYVIWSRFAIAFVTDYSERYPNDWGNNLAKEIFNRTQDSSTSEVTTKSTVIDLCRKEIQRKKAPVGNLKYVLVWTQPACYFPFVDYGIGEKEFIVKNCSVINCYVTEDRNLFGGDLTKFDAIAFNGRIIDGLEEEDLPQVRTPRQKYVYANSESADNYPIRQRFFDDYFNWTYTYRLDSDFMYYNFIIKNKKGEVVGPTKDMKWDEMDNDLPSWLNNNSDIEIVTKNKTKAAAWFVTNCYTLSGREFYVEELNQALKKYNLKVDIYGYCGDLQCLVYMSEECNDLLKLNYFFYMALENSFAKDYVTEKIVTALTNNVIPIVYGAANYSKFLPPDSYIDATSMKPTELADKMHHLMNNLPLYLSYFKWKKHYTYEFARYNLCDFCAALNDETKFNTYSSYRHIRRWWNENDKYKM